MKKIVFLLCLLLPVMVHAQVEPRAFFIEQCVIESSGIISSRHKEGSTNVVEVVLVDKSINDIKWYVEYVIAQYSDVHMIYSWTLDYMKSGQPYIYCGISVAGKILFVALMDMDTYKTMTFRYE